MLTAGHVVTGSANPSEHHQHSNYWSPQYGEGSVYYNSNGKDCGYIDMIPSFDGRYTYDLADKNGECRNLYLDGRYSCDELDKMKSNNESLWVQGRTTGDTETLIDWVGDDSIQLYADTDGGDSGGPYFGIEDDVYYMAGIHAWGMGSENTCRGNKMAKIERWLDVTV